MLDVIFVILLILAVIRGYRRGLIVGIFSFISILIGLAAALKLSASAAVYLGDNINVSGEWVPVISFALVFLVVVLLVQWGAALIQRTIEVSILGWINRLGGVVFYVALYITVFSVLVFYADQVELISDTARDRSISYLFVRPWGPGAINTVAAIMPAFKNMFTDLQVFFGSVSPEISSR